MPESKSGALDQLGDAPSATLSQIRPSHAADAVAAPGRQNPALPEEAGRARQRRLRDRRVRRVVGSGARRRGGTPHRGARTRRPGVRVAGRPASLVLLNAGWFIPPRRMRRWASGACCRRSRWHSTTACRPQWANPDRSGPSGCTRTNYPTECTVGRSAWCRTARTEVRSRGR